MLRRRSAILAVLLAPSAVQAASVESSFLPARTVKEVEAAATSHGRKDPFSPIVTYRPEAVFLGFLGSGQDSGHLYIDPATFAVQGTNRHFWLTTIYGPKNKKYASKSEEADLNCATFEWTTREFLLHDHHGAPKVSSSGFFPHGLAPHTLGRSMGEAICELPAQLASCDGVYHPCVPEDPIALDNGPGIARPVRPAPGAGDEINKASALGECPAGPLYDPFGLGAERWEKVSCVQHLAVFLNVGAIKTVDPKTRLIEVEFADPAHRGRVDFHVQCGDRKLIPIGVRAVDDKGGEIEGTEFLPSVIKRFKAKRTAAAKDIPNFKALLDASCAPDPVPGDHSPNPFE